MEFTVDICNLCALKYLKRTFCTAVTKKKKMQNTMMNEEKTRECRKGDEGKLCKGTLTYPPGGERNH